MATASSAKRPLRQFVSAAASANPPTSTTLVRKLATSRVAVPLGLFGPRPRHVTAAPRRIEHVQQRADRRRTVQHHTHRVADLKSGGPRGRRQLLRIAMRGADHQRTSSDIVSAGTAAARRVGQLTGHPALRWRDARWNASAESTPAAAASAPVPARAVLRVPAHTAVTGVEGADRAAPPRSRLQPPSADGNASRPGARAATIYRAERDRRRVRVASLRASCSGSAEGARKCALNTRRFTWCSASRSGAAAPLPNAAASVCAGAPGRPLAGANGCRRVRQWRCRPRPAGAAPGEPWRVQRTASRALAEPERFARRDATRRGACLRSARYIVAAGQSAAPGHRSVPSADGGCKRLRGGAAECAAALDAVYAV